MPDTAAAHRSISAGTHRARIGGATASTPVRELLDRGERRRLTRLLLSLPFLGSIDALGLALVIAIFLHIVGMHECGSSMRCTPGSSATCMFPFPSARSA